MKIYHKFTRHSLWLASLLLAVLVTGCHSSSNNGSSNNGNDTSNTGGGLAPTVTTTSPADTNVDVALNNSVVATFSVVMDDTTIDTNSFVVVGAGEPALIGVVSFDTATNTARFNPGSNFTPSTVYTATLSNTVSSATNIAMASDYVWSFTSGTTEDTVAPTVSSTNPADMATDVALNSSVSANFSEALDPVTVNASSFTLSDGSSLVSGAVNYSNATATFYPASSLVTNTQYTATLTTAITDQAIPANPLAATVEWSFMTGTSVAAGPAAVNLRTAGDFVILTKSGITNVHTSAITGNIGASPITAAAMDNVFCTEIAGIIYGADAAYTGSGAITCFAGAAPDNTLVADAVLDMETAYADAAGRTLPDFTELHAGDISGQTLTPGLYSWGTGVLISTDVTLSGGPNDVWIFQVAGDVTQASAASILLTGGAVAKNVFWQVAGGAGVSIGTGAHFEGIVLAATGVTVNTGASVNGRLLAQTAVTLDMNAVTQPAP